MKISLKVKTFIQNNMLVEKRGIEVSNKCLLMWGLNVVKREEFCSSFSPEKLFETLSMVSQCRQPLSTKSFIACSIFSESRAFKNIFSGQLFSYSKKQDEVQMY